MVSSTGYDDSQSPGVYTGVFTSGPNAQPIVQDSQEDAIYKLSKDLNVRLDDSTKDYLMQYYLDEQKAQNTQLRQSQAERDYYPNLISGLQKAGINPMLALSGLNGGGTGASSGSTTGGLYTQAKSNKVTSDTNRANAIWRVIGLIAAAIIGAVMAA